MNYNDMAEKIKALCRDVEIKDYKKHITVQVNVAEGGDGSFYIDVNKGKVTVADGKAEHADIGFTASSATFIGLAKGELDPVKAAVSGKLKFSGEMYRIFEFKKVVEMIKAERARMDKEAVMV